MENKKCGKEKKTNSKKLKKGFKPTIAGWMLIMVFFYILAPYIRTEFLSSEPTGKGTIFGIVKDAENETYIENTIIEILDKNLSTKTNEYGKYEIIDVPTGDIEVKFYKSGYRVKIVKIQLYDGKRYNLSVSLDYDAGIKHAEQLEKGIINGKITDKNTKNPIKNASLNIVGTNLSVKTDKNGSYSIKGVVAGIIELEISKKEYNNTIFYKFLLLPGEIKKLNFVLKENGGKEKYDNISGKIGFLKGIVKDENNTPIPNVEISVLGKNSTTSTNSNGTFYIKIQYGKYKVKAEKENYQVVYKYVIISNESYLNFTLKKGSGIEIKSKINEMARVICYIIFAILLVLIFIGGICALKRKSYNLALMGSIFGALLGMQMIVIFILSIIALFLIATSKEEFAS